MDGWPRNGAVFYDEVRVPIATVVGRIGNGWKVAMATVQPTVAPDSLMNASAKSCSSSISSSTRDLRDARARGRPRPTRRAARGGFGGTLMAYLQVSRQEPEGALMQTPWLPLIFVQLQMKFSMMSILGSALDLFGMAVNLAGGVQRPDNGRRQRCADNIIFEPVLGLARGTSQCRTS